MIELTWKQKEPICDLFLSVAHLMAWLTEEINKTHNVGFKYNISCGDEKCATVLITSDLKDEEIVLEHLKQPPGEYKEKYTARILGEKKEEDDNNDEKPP